MSNEVKNVEVENNKVVLVGEIIGEPVFSHEIFGEGFYVFDMNIQRTSGIADTVPVMVSDRMCYIEDIKIGAMFEVNGQFRSYNKHEESKNRLVLSVFAREMSVVEDAELCGENHISLDGYVCKEPGHRVTPLGREIGDLLIAVNRPYGKSDYIPCITWGRNARYTSELPVGSHVKLKGRIQSRAYMKKNGENESEQRVAYEVSASQIELCE